MSLYNDERPRTLDGVVGQEKVVKILAKDFHERSFKQVYLFTGVRGTGKTTFARMIGEAVNCENPLPDGCGCGKCASCKEVRAGSSMDVLELDAASNNSVDDVRELLSSIQYKPLRKKKVYILDECHMLSTAASNALLKCLEEPPKDVIFILCTTELHKVLPTIISRASRHEFEKIDSDLIESHLAKLCQKYRKDAERSALRIIAKAANGGMRDALSILEQFFKEDKICAEHVLTTLGLTSSEACFEVLTGIAEKDPVSATLAVQKVSDKGDSLSYMIEECFSILLDLVEFQITGDVAAIRAYGDDYVNNLVKLSECLTKETAFRIMQNLQDVYFKKSGSLDFAFTASVIRCVYEDGSLENALGEIASLKEEISLLKKQIFEMQQAPSSGGSGGSLHKPVVDKPAANESVFDNPAANSLAPASPILADGFSALSDDEECPFPEYEFIPEDAISSADSAQPAGVIPSAPSATPEHSSVALDIPETGIDMDSLLAALHAEDETQNEPQDALSAYCDVDPTVDTDSASSVDNGFVGEWARQFGFSF